MVLALALIGGNLLYQGLLTCAYTTVESDTPSTTTITCQKPLRKRDGFVGSSPVHNEMLMGPILSRFV